ncbi:hypothetical protein F5B19DRAFT_25957 [Rostrohypoxylon terebratum]|nr:hypothetical protein F5B19DRAFT_25957 [Rostrohypoxylon terebratum]
MFAANFITVVVSALAATVAAETVAPRETYGTWHAKGFAEECVEPTKCHATFSISAEKGYTPDAPGFSTHCRPAMNEKAIACDSPDVQASFTGPDKLKITVIHTWAGQTTNGHKARYTATANADVSTTKSAFDVPVTKVEVQA